jgi:hypothetical protein
MLEHFALRQHGDELAGSHGKRAGEQAGNAGKHDDVRLGRGAGHAHYQAGVGHEPVIHAEHAGAQHAAAEGAMPSPDVLDGLGPRMSGWSLRLAAIDRDAAHLAERMGRMARGPKAAMQLAMRRERSDGMKSGVRPRS